MRAFEADIRAAAGRQKLAEMGVAALAAAEEAAATARL